MASLVVLQQQVLLVLLHELHQLLLQLFVVSELLLGEVQLALELLLFFLPTSFLLFV